MGLPAFARSFSGISSDAADYTITVWLFLRLIGWLYISAFLSMAPQIVGLVGAEGILPIAEKLKMLRESSAAPVYWRYPTIFWFDSSDQALSGACWLGAVAGVAVFLNLFTRFALTICYGLYLSVVYAGQDFTLYQWDMFLLEAGFLSIFVSGRSKPVLFLFRWLLFRFMFMGGLVKLASGDPTWADLTALTYHYETQPLPSPLAWYAHHFPLWVHRFSVAVVFLIELVIPFFIFMTRRLRIVAAYSFILLQSSIIATGNYNFFNLLTIALCLFLFDDRSLDGIVGKQRAVRMQRIQGPESPLAHVLAIGLLSIVLISNATLAWVSNSRDRPPWLLYELMQATLIFGIANTYGPFAVMTTRRGEIEIEASLNGVDWNPYEFRYKPGRLDKELNWIIPHQPRLDWQMWFAALRPNRPPFWFSRLITNLERGNPAVLGLFRRVPFAGIKPRFIRAKFYRYRYSNPALRRATGQLWTREYLGIYWGSQP